jgi:hypothetical protein
LKQLESYEQQEQAIDDVREDQDWIVAEVGVKARALQQECELNDKYRDWPQ